MADPTGPHDPAPDRVSLTEIALVFGRIGATSFGGGLSAWIYREVVDQRRWLDEDEFLSGLTLAQILPGPNVVNLSIYVGQRLRGFVGGLTAVMAMMLPPMAAVLVIVALFQNVAHISWVHDFLEGLAAAAIGMSLSVGVKAARRAARTSAWLLLVVGGVFGAIALMRWPLLVVVLGAVPLALALAWRSRPHAR